MTPRRLDRIVHAAARLAAASGLVLAAAALPARTGAQAGAPVAPDSAPSADIAPTAADSAPADSVALIARLLRANGGDAARATEVAIAVLKYSAVRALDPLLVIGIIGVENPDLATSARSHHGAVGIMQVHIGWLRRIRDCGDDLRDVDVNVCFGTRVLRLAIDESRTLEGALRRYNGCRRGPKCDRYIRAVFSRAGRALIRTRAATGEAG